MATDMDNLNRFVAKQNLERLHQYKIALGVPDSDGNAIGDGKCQLAYPILESWSDKNADSIKKAIAAQVFGHKNPIDWNIAFFPFMESMAVYLRDYGKVLAAHEKYAKWKDPEVATTPEVLEDAISTYISAADDINKVAKLWDMEFMQICDLPHKGPGEHPRWSGPYCGAFYTTKAQKSNAFIGLVFKGTSPFNLREILVDKNYQLVPAVDFLQDQSVSEGVYTGLFGDFSEKDKPSYKPYNHIVEQLDAIAKALPRDEGTTIRAHVTGHSLGGSYSSLCSAQLLIDVPKLLPGFKMGDEYTFGAPRVGSNDWALMNRSLATEGDGQIWRIVNSGDLVPQVPPTDLFKITDSFYHTDQGVAIFEDKAPEDIASEINGPPPPGRKFKSWKELIRAILDSRPHFPDSYYNSMVEAIKTTTKGENTETNGF